MGGCLWNGFLGRLVNRDLLTASGQKNRSTKHPKRTCHDREPAPGAPPRLNGNHAFSGLSADKTYSYRSTGSHAEKKLNIARSALHLAKQQIHRLDRRNTGQRAAQDRNAAGLVRMVEQFLFARARTLNVDGGKDAPMDQGAMLVVMFFMPVYSSTVASQVRPSTVMR